jgi:U4/U6 small nuclear ribonucleoprotein PRP3
MGRNQPADLSLPCLAGIMLVCPAAFSLVVVEGGPKSIKRYQKLMLRRIDWSATPSAAGLQDEDQEAEDGTGEADNAGKPMNSCHLVWQVRHFATAWCWIVLQPMISC